MGRGQLQPQKRVIKEEAPWATLLTQGFEYRTERVLPATCPAETSHLTGSMDMKACLRTVHTEAAPSGDSSAVS